MLTGTAANVTPRVLQPSSIGRCELIGKHHDFHGRPTVVSPLIFEKREVLLVRNARGGNWIFPQGGYTESDRILSRAAQREIMEELSMSEADLLGYEVLLGQCPNKEKNKHLFVLAAPVRRNDRVVLNAENDAFEWVRSYEHFCTLVDPTANEHPLKHKLMLDALELMHAHNLLRWSCAPRSIN